MLHAATWARRTFAGIDPGDAGGIGASSTSKARGWWVLGAEKHEQIWIPPGFAHGFLVLSDTAGFLYKTTAWYAPEHERCIVWNDPAIGSSGRSGACLRCGRRKDARAEGLASALRWGRPVL